ncbi:alpha-glucuronidase family glycosyl hydrolase [Asticcacaulis tiandongensis]|uniref:alpha-glucuronidase family glycosyl hydrolase n=1 Tax=Asticcacaulis tiandongensis TaxID=2565365 RepID=UPI001C63C825|nr:alpha-glucuronidase family glycosyl hydrolase [Asticcacaulis tiandongensis]
MLRPVLTRLLISLMACLLPALAPAATLADEDGYDLWLRYIPLEQPLADTYRPQATALVTYGDSPTLKAASDELHRGLKGLLGQTPASTLTDGAIVIGTIAQAPIPTLNITLPDNPEAYAIRKVTLNGKSVTLITGHSDQGVLYGAFAYLKTLQTGARLTDVTDAPRVKLRVLNHWDNLDGFVERGYSGASIWDWWRLPDLKDPRYTDYARANASIGINGTVLNNVNSKADSLTLPYLHKAAAVADILRPYGIKVYLSARFSAPIELGGLPTSDPLDPAVQKWWQDKTAEIYAIIPDFGGFLVKANSEGQPGPQDFGRTHADGANMLAAALKSHGGIVMWRAFVYSHDNPADRAKQAYDEFVPLDGTFADNVLVQVKNGAIDFQPREPFHPLFGAMPKTPLMMEFQITKEYLGFATHIAYMGEYFEETLRADTGHGKIGAATVAHVLDGSLHGYTLTGIAGVANIGTDRNWSGSDFEQANWYAFGRLAWNPHDSARAIAADWAKLTFSRDDRFVTPVTDLLMSSRETVADYMTPLGLHHLMGTSHHYGPAPWINDLPQPEWNPVYYHKADRDGIGFDRTQTGSDALSQYAPRAAAKWANPKTTDERYLLWFHHLSWDHKTRSGRPLWDELALTYTRGTSKVTDMRRTWDSLRPFVDARRHQAVAQNLKIQETEAVWWRDASLAYFRSVSHRPLPAGAPEPAHSLEHYQSLRFPYAPGDPGR